MTETELLPVDTLPTPNPDALMFRVQEALITGGTYEFKTRASAATSPLPKALFELPGVIGILVARNFVTVTREESTDWPELVPAVKSTLRAFLESGDLAVDAELAPTPAPARTPLEQQIVDLIEESIRPVIAQDGGDVEYMGFDDGVVELRLQGSCGSCPHATATLAFGIQRFLTEQIPEVKGVRRVF